LETGEWRTTMMDHGPRPRKKGGPDRRTAEDRWWLVVGAALGAARWLVTNGAAVAACRTAGDQASTHSSE
jgi:hypothetical protein